MSKVIFVCHENVGRSQIAEAFYNYYTNSNDAISGGTDSCAPHMYHGPGKIVIQAMQEKGIDVSGKKVKYATSFMLKNAEEVYILCRKEVLSIIK